MIKFSGIVEDGKKIHGTNTKYIFTATPDNTVALDGAELIPIDLGGRLITHPAVTISINELGKQLLKAAADGDVDEIKNLLTKGAPFTADWLGTSPLHLAAQNNHLEITEILLRAGISKDARTKVDRTPLHMAAYEGHLQIVDTLIKQSADIDCRDLLGMTPLHWAVQNGHYEVVEYLVLNGAQINAHNKFNLTPALIARQTGRMSIENFLNNGLTNSLVIQLATEDVAENNSESQGFSEDMDLEGSNHESIVIPIEPDEFIAEQHEQLVQDVNINTSNFSDSLKILQQHGITMLQNDENEDSNILNTVMESGHSVVLTDVGKEVLNSVKRSEQQLQMNKKIVTVTTEEFLAMANGSINNNKNILRQLKVLPKSQVKRIVMKKNKVIPVTSVTSIPSEQKQPSSNQSEKSSRTDMELVMTQLIEARKTIEEYKVKLHKKEQEAERYKMQLKLLMGPN
ncbi:hypothetical protein NQ314_004015 [Rhamnusium bicolor]|uniref:GA-binding protein subunit beta-2 n=1 Tax=Rhamnusium bicolor TaxID=1586634 RepID=A0AAV8ZN29_9CUCU|nr:hypothetical protein NQ314_004015 [Rhamnusium bicolor]